MDTSPDPVADAPAYPPGPLPESAQEPAPETMPETTTTPLSAASPAAARRSGFGGMLAGGALAAAAGFGLSLLILPEGTAPATNDHADRIAALESRLETLATKPVDPPADPRIPKLEASIANLGSGLAALEPRLTALENQPSGVAADPAALAALASRLVALESRTTTPQTLSASALAEIDAAAQAAADRLSETEQQARALQAQAEITAAIGRLQGSIDSGSPFAPLLKILAAQDIAIPAALVATAETGVASLRTLQDSFPEAARAALSASLRADPGEGWTDRLGTFLQSQTGARSLAPQIGSDPDAVLSRAEAALAAGDVTAALTELATLPPEGQAAMADWQAAAQARADALAAIPGLAEAAP